MRVGVLTGGGDCPGLTKVELVPLAVAVAEVRTVPVDEYRRVGVLFG